MLSVVTGGPPHDELLFFRDGFPKGRVQKKFKKLAFDQKGGGGRRKNQLANLIFYFSTNNEYGI